MHEKQIKERLTPEMWSPWLHHSTKRKHLAIFQALASDIATGKLRRGDKLPTQRSVAESLHVNLSTVTKAFNKARSEGLVEATIGKGTFVSTVPLIADTYGQTVRHFVDLSMNNPPHVPSISLTNLIARSIQSISLSTTGPSFFSYSEGTGDLFNRKAGAIYLGRILKSAPLARIAIMGGAQAALYSIFHLICSSKCKVAVGQFTYAGVHRIAAQLPLSLVPVEMDGKGIRPESLEEICRTCKPEVLYVTPSADNPTTACLPIERRLRLIEIAERYGMTIIEDDPYRVLVSSNIPALYDLSPERTWHISTISKCISPTLRLAYVLSPSDECNAKIGTAAQALMMMPSPLLATIVSRWIYSDFVGDVVHAMRKENSMRYKIAAELFGDLKFAGSPNIPHLWLHLPDPWDANDFAVVAERNGVRVVSSASFSPTKPMSQAVRIALGAAVDQESLGSALKLIRATMLQPASNSIAAVV